MTQQAFVEAVRNRNRFRGDAGAGTWVIGIARHKLADHFRRLEAEERNRLRLYERLAPSAATRTVTG